MLNANLYDQHVAARLLDFFGARTPWQRTLWTPSTVLILKEVLEASEAIQAGVLKDASLRNLSSSVLSLTGPDPGVGGEERRRTLHNALRSEFRFNGAEFHVVKTLLAGIEEQYLHLLAQAVGQNPRVGPERVARYVAAHMLDSGFSASYLHRWWTFRVTHQNGTRSLSDLLEDANQLVVAAPKRFRVLVAFEAAAEGKSGMPAGWLTAREISGWLKTNEFKVANLRQNGGMWFQTQARDPWSAVENVVEIVDRLSSRIGLGTTGHLTPVRTAWVEGEREQYAFRIRRRRVEVHALHREDKLYALGQGSIVDAAIELLGPLDSGSPDRQLRARGLQLRHCLADRVMTM